MSINNYIRYIGNTKRWNRRIINIYWCLVLVSIAIQSVNLFLTQDSIRDYFVNNILVTTVFLVVITSITELIYRKDHSHIDYIIISNGTLMAAIFTGIHYEIVVIWATFFLPFLISVFYFSKKKILFAFYSTFGVYLLLCITNKGIREMLTLMDHFTMVAILITATITCIGIMRRGLEILDNLKVTMESKQELLIQNTIMEKLSKTDSLTGLYNHMSFHEFLEDIIQQSNKYHFPIQLALLDIDDFKEINDTYGHRSGDFVIEHISNIIKENVSSDDFVARYGGEEFVILFVGRRFEETYNTVENIRREINLLKLDEIEGRRLSVSIGLNEYEENTDKETLFKGTDSLLYISKQNGKNKTTSQSSL